MAIKIDCPRCKTPLLVPNKKTGSYVNCPKCRGRLWVPKDARTDAAAVEAVMPACGPIPPPAPPPRPTLAQPGGVPGPVPPRGAASMSAPESTPLPISPAAPPSTPRKVARFISAQAAQSKLQPAEDGKLPALQLQEGEEEQKTEQKTTTVNPLVLLGLLCLSIVLSISLVLIDVEPAENAASRRKENARLVIEEEFFGEIGSQEPRQPYQRYLREAQRAHTQGDRKHERMLYGRVLDLLRAERGPHERGLTGSRSRDKQLAEQISILLGND